MASLGVRIGERCIQLRQYAKSSNMSRYNQMVKIMSKNATLVNLMRQDNILNGKKSNWVLDKVCILLFLLFVYLFLILLLRHHVPNFAILLPNNR